MQPTAAKAVHGWLQSAGDKGNNKSNSLAIVSLWSEFLNNYNTYL